MKNKKAFILKNKNILIGTLLLFVILSSLGIKIYNDKKADSDIKFQVGRNEKELEKLKANLEEMQSDQNGYLIEDFKIENFNILKLKLENIRKNYNDLKKNSNRTDMKKYMSLLEANESLLGSIEKKYNIQNQVNSLFYSEDNKLAINGKRVNQDLPIIDKYDSVDKIKKDHYVEKASNEWETSINSLILNAEKQAKEIDAAKQKVEKFFTGDKVMENPSAEELQLTKQEVEKIKNDKIKRDLLSQLDKVQQAIEEMAKKEEQEKTVQDQGEKKEDSNYNEQSSTTTHESLGQNTNKEEARSNGDQGASQGSNQSSSGSGQNSSQGSGASQNPNQETGQESGSGQVTPPTPPTSPPAPNAFSSHAEAVSYGERTYGTDGYFMVTIEGWHYVYPN